MYAEHLGRRTVGDRLADLLDQRLPTESVEQRGFVVVQDFSLREPCLRARDDAESKEDVTVASLLSPPCSGLDRS